MRNHKKHKWHISKGWIALIIVVLILVGVVANYRYNTSKAYVESVEMLTSPWALSGDSYNGTISDAATQNIYLTESEQVAEVYVAKGDTVSKGDSLFQYDTTTLQSQYDEAALSVEAAENALANEKSRLEKYNAIVPVEKTETTPSEPVVFTPSVEQTLPEAYAGSGTLEDPYLYLCTEETLVSGSQINDWIYNGTVAVLEIRDGNTVDGDLLSSWTINGNEFIEVSDDSYWQVISRSEYFPEIDEPDVVEDTTVTYTQAEKDKKVKEQTIAVQKAEDQVASAKTSLNAAEVKLNNATVTATMDGTVQTIGDAANPPKDGSPFLTLTSESGLAVTGYLSEFELNRVHTGDEISVTAWESGTVGTAEITSISPYPAEGVSQYTSGNNHVSWYPFTAVLDDADGYTTGESVEIQVNNVDLESTIVILGVYVRTDEKGSYVLIDNGSGRLKRQEVTTEVASGDAEYVIVTEGLEMDDMVAFPYGSKAKVGTKTTTEMSIFDMLF